MKTVYLAGPILGASKGEANAWRRTVAAVLERNGLRGVSPLRCEPLVGDHYAPVYADDRFGTSRAITSKNFFDTKACDMVLAYLPKPPPGRHQSYGTIAEIGWAHALGKAVIVVTDDPSVAEHPVINGCAGWMLNSLDDALEVIVGILGGYTPGGKHV